MSYDTVEYKRLQEQVRRMSESISSFKAIGVANQRLIDSLRDRNKELRTLLDAATAMLRGKCPRCD